MARLQAAQGQNPTFHWFLPHDNTEPYLDRNLQPVRVHPFGALLGKRLADLVANSSKICTSMRMKIEQFFARQAAYKLSGTNATLCHYWAERSGSQPTPDMPVIFIWLAIINLHIHRTAKPFQNYIYPIPAGVGYGEHGRALIRHIEKVPYVQKQVQRGRVAKRQTEAE